MTTPRTTAGRPASDRPGIFRRHWGVTAVLVLVLLPAVLFALWTMATLSYTYSTGDRVGYNQKFSRKGWICKTWEGELAISNAPGQAPQIFTYSVRDDVVAQRIRQLEGQRIAITYRQHVHVPTRCFGETEYFVVSARPAVEAPFPGYGPAVPTGTAATGTVAPGAVVPATPAAPR